MTQEDALKILKAGHNVYLTGAPGSGKTYLLNEYIRFLKKKRIFVGVTASTGIAATHLGGFTIHSWAGIGIEREMSDAEVKLIATKRRVAKRFAQAKTLIIDEISMLDADRLDLIDRVARAARGSPGPFGGIQTVFCGDFFQLPPITKEGELPPRFAYHSSVWEQMNLKICYLHEQHRQGDEKFIQVLNAIRQNNVSEVIKSRLCARRGKDPVIGRITKLYSHNINVDEENARELARLSGKEMLYKMEESGIKAILESLKKGCLAPERLVIKQRAKVMFIKNNFDKGFVNGTLGEVAGFDDSGFPIVVTFNGDKIIASPETWSIEENGRALAKITQVPLRLAWAITVHKSQGMTLDAVEIDLSGAFEKGMGYVALSRVRSLAGINLLGFNDIALQVHPEILEFDNALKESSERAMRELGELSKEKHSKVYSVAEIRESHPSAYQKWLPEEDEKLISGFKSGIAIRSLVSVLGRRTGAIFSRLRKLKLIE